MTIQPLVVEHCKESSTSGCSIRATNNIAGNIVFGGGQKPDSRWECGEPYKAFHSSVSRAAKVYASPSAHVMFHIVGDGRYSVQRDVPRARVSKGSIRQQREKTAPVTIESLMNEKERAQHEA